MIIQTNDLNSLAAFSTYVVVPLNGANEKNKDYPTNVFLKKGEAGTTKDVVIACHQIRVLDQSRFTSGKLGELSEDQMREVQSKLAWVLGLS